MLVIPSLYGRFTDSWEINLHIAHYPEVFTFPETKLYATGTYLRF